MRPAHGEHGRRGQADQAGQADGERGADQLRHRAAGQDAEALDGVQAGLGDAERAGPGVGAQRLHERGGRGELVGAARAGQRPQRQHGPQRGLHALPISGAQDRTASQPIILIRADGAAILLIRTAPITMPRGTAAIRSPTVSAVPCRERAYGAARPSGTM